MSRKACPLPAAEKGPLLSVIAVVSLQREKQKPLLTCSSAASKAHAPCWLETCSSDLAGGVLNLCSDSYGKGASLQYAGMIQDSLPRMWQAKARSGTRNAEADISFHPPYSMCLCLPKASAGSQRQVLAKPVASLWGSGPHSGDNCQRGDTRPACPNKRERTDWYRSGHVPAFVSKSWPHSPAP